MNSTVLLESTNDELNTMADYEKMWLGTTESMFHSGIMLGRSIVERCDDGSMGMFEWLFWCKVPISVTFSVVMIVLYVVVILAATLAAKFTRELVEDFNKTNTWNMR